MLDCDLNRVIERHVQHLRIAAWMRCRAIFKTAMTIFAAWPVSRCPGGSWFPPSSWFRDLGGSRYCRLSCPERVGVLKDRRHGQGVRGIVHSGAASGRSAGVGIGGRAEAFPSGGVGGKRRQWRRWAGSLRRQGGSFELASVRAFVSRMLAVCLGERRKGSRSLAIGPDRL